MPLSKTILNLPFANLLGYKQNLTPKIGDPEVKEL